MDLVTEYRKFIFIVITNGGISYELVKPSSVRFMKYQLFKKLLVMYVSFRLALRSQKPKVLHSFLH